ncbi:MAG: tetratricopeptide repeat protein [Carboxydocellales bacterium]
MIIIVPLWLLISGLGVYFPIKKYSLDRSSFRLVVDDSKIKLTQRNLPDVEIFCSRVKSIRELAEGILVESYSDGHPCFVLVPKELEGYLEVKNHLATWRDIEPYKFNLKERIQNIFQFILFRIFLHIAPLLTLSFLLTDNYWVKVSFSFVVFIGAFSVVITSRKSLNLQRVFKWGIRSCQLLIILAGSILLFVLLVPPTVTSYITQANKFVESDEYELAINYFEKAIKIDPKNAEAYIGKAQALDLLNLYSESLEYANQGITLNPNDAQAYIIKAIALTDLKRYSAALITANKAIKLKSESAEAYNAKGNALYFSERYEEALICYEKVIKLDPGLVHAYNSKGNTLYSLGKYEEAIKSYDETINVDSDYKDAYYSKADILYKFGKYRESIEYFNKYIERDSEYAPAFYYKSRSLAKLGVYDESLASLKKAIALDNSYIQSAKQEEAFEKMKSSEEFQKLIDKNVRSGG